MTKLSGRNILFLFLFQAIIITGSLSLIADNSIYSTNSNQNLQSIKKPLNAEEPTTLIYQGGFGEIHSNTYAMAVDSEGYKYVTGRYVSEYTVYPDYTTLDNIDFYVTKFDKDGHTQIFRRNFGGIETETPTAIIIDDTGAIYISGFTN